MWNISFKLFVSFFKIGAFTLGGGYAMLPLIEEELVSKKKWLSKEDFLEAVVIAQSVPGVLAANTAIISGYKVAGKKGSFFSLLGSILPSFLIILLLSKFILIYRDNEIFNAFMNGIKPATVALIFIAVYKMGLGAKLNKYTFILPIIVALLIFFLHISPIIILIFTMLFGNIFFAWRDKK